jgi:rare lipoprotein A
MSQVKFALGVLVSLLIACGATARAGSDDKARDEWRVGDTQDGKATWYGKKFHGKPTASGEKFDMRSMTAAHRSLPFGSVVRVTNLKNDRQVTVRINNRGPFGKGRVIDVSQAAARKLKMIDAGVVPASIEVLVIGDGATKHGRQKKKPKKKKEKNKTPTKPRKTS